MLGFNIGLIGAGNMGRAIIHGLLEGGVSPQRLHVYDVFAPCCEPLAARGVHIGRSIEDVCIESYVVIIAVKPKDVAYALSRCTADKLYISIAMGLTTDTLQSYAPGGARVVRVMPNMPTEIRQGVSVVARTENTSDSDIDVARRMFECIGAVEVVDESLMDAVVAISGSGPAYVFAFIEALADAGVREGLPRDIAYRLAASMVQGSAAMVVGGTHPAVLKDKVCSPAGTTIDAICALEANGFGHAVHEAVSAAARKSRATAGR